MEIRIQREKDMKEMTAEELNGNQSQAAAQLEYQQFAPTMGKVGFWKGPVQTCSYHINLPNFPPQNPRHPYPPAHPRYFNSSTVQPN